MDPSRGSTVYKGKENIVIKREVREGWVVGGGKGRVCGGWWERKGWVVRGG